MNRSIVAFALLALLLITSCGKTGQVRRKKVLTVATYNVHYFTGGVNRVAHTIGKINPDILALQEVLYKNGVDYSKILSRRLGYYQASSIPYQYFKSGNNWVLSILSRYPIIKIRQRRLDKYRRALKVHVRVGSRVVCMVTTHLSPMVWSRKNLIVKNIVRSRMRHRELAQLLEFASHEKYPTVLLGDFNMTPDEEGIHYMTLKGYDDADYRPFKKNNKTYRINRYVVKRLKNKLPDFLVPDEVTLDYIFLKGEVRALSTGVRKSRVSDHYPLFGRLEID